MSVPSQIWFNTSCLIIALIQPNKRKNAWRYCAGIARAICSKPKKK